MSNLQIRIRNIALSVIGVIASTAAIGVWKFYHDWTLDEETEEAQMFDSAEQKVEVIMHVNNAFSSGELIQNRLMDSLLIDKLLIKLNTIENTVKHADSMAKLNADQVYLIKEEIKSE